MAILTRGRLETLTAGRFESRTFSEVLNEVKNQSRITATTTIFLSHSHADLVDGTVDRALVFLRRMGVRMYIDTHDTSMPPLTNALTAKKIKDAIVGNRKFILLATDRAIGSKWCNWELGYGDAKRYIDNIALLPLAENYSNYTGVEYLSIYPRIEEVSEGFRNNYYVFYPDGSKKTITDWLI
jgi:hypothetical protein